MAIQQIPTGTREVNMRPDVQAWPKPAATPSHPVWLPNQGAQAVVEDMVGGGKEPGPGRQPVDHHRHRRRTQTPTAVLGQKMEARW